MLFEVERAMKVFCDKHDVISFLTQEEWKSSGKIEAILYNASRLTTICQNKKNQFCTWTSNAKDALW